MAGHSVWCIWKNSSSSERRQEEYLKIRWIFPLYTRSWYNWCWVPESETSAWCCDLHCTSPVILEDPGCYQARDPPHAAFLLSVNSVLLSVNSVFLSVNSVLPRWGGAQTSPEATSRDSSLVLRHCKHGSAGFEGETGIPPTAPWFHPLADWALSANTRRASKV